jgi:hypothetical protein
MMEEYNIRPLQLEDYSTLVKWWESYDHIVTPESHMLPEGGLGGFIVEKEGRPMAAGFLYLTNSTVGYVDYLVSDPNYKGKDRFEMITWLIEACSEEAIRQGCRITWAMTTYSGIVRRCDKLGYEVLDEKYSVIYTHHKIHEEMIKQEENE